MSSSVPRAPSLGLLLRVKARSIANRISYAFAEAPIKPLATMILVPVVWLGLWALFRSVFMQFYRTPLEATVAIPLVFNFFFFAMLLMLTFSNAIIVYGSLFGTDESAFLLTTPFTPLDVVSLKYLESVVLASWSLVLLGMPLMVAMADSGGMARDTNFYLLFIAFFLAFIPIPAAIGMVIAWAAALYFPRRAKRLLGAICAVAVAGAIFMGFGSLRFPDTATEEWLRSFMAKMSFVESAFLPSYWVAEGIDNVLQGRHSRALLYLGVTIANAMFLSWLAVRLVARRFDAARDRAMSGRSVLKRNAAPASGGVAGWLFVYLPLPLRLIAAKDLRTFFRDPMQWGQLVILFGLVVLYLTNMPSLRVQFGDQQRTMLIPFLNLCAISLILATFTCRFVFPLVSVEGRQLWLVGLLPMNRGKILLAKFCFAMTVTVAVAVGTVLLASLMLGLELYWTFVHLVITVGICFGLCGCSVGIGARLPMFHESNVARIANGLGGTANLLASVAMVAVVLAGLGSAMWRVSRVTPGGVVDYVSLAYLGGSLVVAIMVGTGAMWMGARHLNRVDV